MSQESIMDEIYQLLAFDTNEEKAVAYGVNRNEDEFEYKELQRHGDIYQLIDEMSADKLATNFDFISLITYGWAAPIEEVRDEEIAPSKSENRRRIRLMLVGSKENNGILGSALKFADNEEIVFDFGDADGPLSDVFNTMYQ